MKTPRTASPDGNVQSEPTNGGDRDLNAVSRRLFAFAALALPMAASAKSLAALPRPVRAPQPSNPTPAKIETKMTPDQIDKTFQTMADSFKSWPNAPIMHWPDEVGLAYETVSFPSEDGVPLEAWFIPRAGSDKIVIANHPRWFNRSGLPSHLEPWKKLAGGTGNDFEVNFVPDYKLLHDAGYNVLAYDLRNFGHSGTANGGLFSVGRYESRDVIGSLSYVRERKDTRDMTIGLFSRCMGCNATFYAMERQPDAFKDVRCLVAPQPLSAGVAMKRALERMEIPADRFDDLNDRVRLATSFTIEQFSPVPWAKSVTVPTFLYQVRDDLYTRPSDVQAMFDNIPVREKKLHWIEGSTRRWDGYTYFQREPRQMLDWFARFMA